MVHTEEEVDKQLDSIIEDLSQNAIIAFNDDVNTFEHVIECLVKYCNHGKEQAEQCALITHLKGKCSVKTGCYVDLVPIANALSENGLTVEIQ